MKIAGILAVPGLLLGSLATASAGELDFAVGKALFDRLWTSAPASTDATDGLGPLFNARSCAACHPQGGRGAFEEDAQGRIIGPALLVRLGTEKGAGDPVYGRQLQTQAVPGVKAEGYLVRDPSGRLRAEGLSHGPLHAATRVSGRLAPDLHGLGALQNIPAEAILAWADPEDENGDGISGRAHYTYGADGDRVLGRFGWKAAKATVRVQSAAALNTEIGLSNPVYPDHFGDCTDTQAECRTAPHGASPRFDNLEVGGQMLDLIASYVAGLPPRQGRADAAGRELFTETGCAACHRPEFRLEDGSVVAPYTDLLLHDMGDALADGLGEGEATGREWRTAPLWGLSRAVRFLHDGRARSPREAIERHGGEAASTRAAFLALPADAQERLLSFLSGL